MLELIYNKYFTSLIVIAIIFSIVEINFPFRNIKKNPSKFLTDTFYQIFNFSIFGAFVELCIIFTYSFLDLNVLSNNTFSVNLFKNIDPIYLFFISLLLVDFLDYCIHNLLHRVPVLWEFHKIHHSIQHLDWWGNMLFHPMEIFFYKFFLYAPLLLLNPILPETYFFVLVLFRLSIGTFAHSNLNIDIGPLKYIINNPKVHCWHHANDDRAINKNLGVTFTFWDFIFRTALLQKNETYPKKGLGFSDDLEYQSFFKQFYKPFTRIMQLKVGKHRASTNNN